ncbi:MAG: hypothetical protein KGQ89_03765 [Verrucomicrobia bacterium]|nr:hypothetical protein [Verrucomicrobiota bacterium]
MALNSAKLGGRAPQTSPYIAIHLFSRATFTGNKVNFSNVSFTVTDPTINLVDAFAASGEANNTTPVVDSYLAYFNSDGSKGDLSTVGCRFSANVSITSTGNSKECEIRNHRKDARLHAADDLAKTGWSTAGNEHGGHRTCGYGHRPFDPSPPICKSLILNSSTLSASAAPQRR